jgi:hypothetical protein
MTQNFIKKITSQVYEFSAFFAPQMKVFPLCYIRRPVLVAGAFAIGGSILADDSGVHQLFQMPVDSSQPYGFPGIAPEVIGYIVYRNMEIPQGSQVINDKPSLPGTVPGTSRTFGSAGSRLSILFRMRHGR